ncbi:TonB system biopolymer transport component; Chromosome segregation ATPase [hydrothermal vent metagenome]|uniref:TonB system biopolymer transport component Chromosome segregation ATPase n=1 Tax=hydrothermal vent metagenome TaxID=652676 RepID=A0A3B1BLE0_9ZZZZ
MNRPTEIKWHCIAVALLVIVSSIAASAAEDPFKESISSSIKGNRQEAKTQVRIEGLSDQTSVMLEEYQQLSRELEVLLAYNNQLQRLVDSQGKEKASLQEQMDGLEATQREIIPLMLRMVASLQEFVTMDHPFLPDERWLRVTQIQALMDRADVSIGEKYRRVLEAYQIEMEYGRTIEAYRGELKTDTSARTVNFLRIGRVGLYYQTLDRQETGQWDITAGGWRKLPAQYSLPIRKGLRIARKQSAPELLYLPMPVPQEMVP